MLRTKHKETNRFKFIPFSERISSINVDVIHRVPHRYEEADQENETNVYQAIKKWNVLNLTENYTQFRKELTVVGIKTLPQLINNKEIIVNVVRNHLKLQDALSIQPILEILIALVKDLRSEFYIYFRDVFLDLIPILKSKDATILEVTFSCLAYLVKYVGKDLVKDLDKVLLDLAPLLDDGNPGYVQDFAAQSFAFVARKVRDKNKLISLVLHTMQTCPQISQGCCKLVFETMRGIKGMPHSSASDTLTIILSMLGLVSYPKKLVFMLLLEVVKYYLTGIKADSSELMQILLKALSMSKTNHKKAIMVLRIIKMVLDYRSGILLKNPRELAEILFTLVKNSTTLPVPLWKEVASVAAKILVIKDIPQELATKILRTMLTIEDISILLGFVESVATYSGFEALILPHLVRMLRSSETEERLQLQCTLAKILVEQGATSWPRVELHSLHLTLAGDAEDQMCGLLLVSRLFDPSQDLVQIVKDTVARTLQDDQLTPSIRLLQLCVALDTCIRLSIQLELSSSSFLALVTPNLADCNYLLALRALSLYLTVNTAVQDTERISELVQPFLLSAHSNVRLVTLTIMAELHKDSELGLVIADCIVAESVPLTVASYREKLIVLERLKYEKLSHLPPTQIQIPLKFLLGILYSNFQLLWEPLFDLIASYAEESFRSLFWPVFYSQLQFTSQACYNETLEAKLPELRYKFLANAVLLVTADDKADHFNYRLQLWKCFACCGDLSEIKNRDVVTIFLEFTKEELRTSRTTEIIKINVKQFEESEVVDRKVSEAVKSKAPVTALTKLAVAKLNLLSTWKNPSQVHRHTELSDAYLALLLHRSNDVQKAALECVLTYKCRAVTPYKQHLRSIVDDKKFKDAVVAFQLDERSGVVEESHREQLMPVLMRIVLSKMVSRMAVQRGSKGGAAALRRSLIMKFLAGCRHTEMHYFLQQAFAPFNSFITDEELAVAALKESVNLEHCPSPKQLHGTLSLLEVVLEQFGGLMSVPLQQYVLRVLCVVEAFVAGALSQRDALHEGFVPSLKALRTAALTCLSMFFNKFTTYPWSATELDAVCNVFVWPELAKLPTDSVHSPTPLLKLFATWSSHPRYFPLLSRYAPSDESLTPLPYVMRLLLGEKTSHGVVVFVWQMLERMLTLDGVEKGDEEMEAEVAALPEDCNLTVRHDVIKQLNLKQKLNKGSQLLVPHVAAILERLLRQMQRTDGRTNLSKCEVVVLSRVTELATSAEHGDALLSLLLRLVSDTRRQWAEDVLCNVLTTILNLFTIVPEPLNYTRPLSALFSSVEVVPARKLLLEVLKVLETRCPSCTTPYNLLIKLNAFNYRWIDQPDFDARLNAFKDVQLLTQKHEVPLDLGLMVLHNCFYLVRVEKDLSLRDCATQCLRQGCPSVANSLHSKGQTSEMNLFVEAVLKLVRADLVAKEDNMQASAISLLGVMARECSALHLVLRDLFTLTSATDTEVDFFENAQHLQIYRRLRALQRFSNIAKTLKQPFIPRSLTQFVLPLATQYLCSDRYAGKNSLVDSAIECVACVSRLLPWYQYQALLRYYLAKLRTSPQHQRQLIRTVIGILDAFHFDISRAAELDKEPEPQPTAAAAAAAAAEITPENPNEAMVMDEAAPEHQESLDFMDVEEEKEDEEEKKEESPEVLAMEALVRLKPRVAARVERTIRSSLLGQLKAAIGERTQLESTHRLNKKQLGPGRDEEDIVRIPLAVALVKLLQKLPGTALDEELPGVFMRLCTFLKSRLQSVRRSVRETLQQIMLAVSPRYLPALLQEMTALLTRGFHLYVLVFTTHAVVQSLSHLLQPGDLDTILPTILEVCKADLFGAASEEKEVARIQVKNAEARTSKSYHLLHVTAQYLTEKHLTDLVVPIKEVLATSHSHKVLVKCRECLHQIALGLSVNTFVSSDSLLQFLYGAASQSIPELMPHPPPPPPKKHNPRVRTDCFVIAEEPRSRSGALSEQVKTGKRSNAHLLVEFGLELLLTLLKKERLRDVSLASYLDPMVPLLVTALSSQHVKVTTVSLQCLSRIMTHQLPTLRACVPDITSALFSLLHKYAAAGLSKGDNFDLVVAAFKTMSVMVRDVDHFTVDAAQLKLLLLYTEQDLHDHSRQATAFTMLKAILRRKFTCPELPQLMHKVAAMSVTSEAPHIQVSARHAVFKYLMDYPLGGKLDEIVGFYLSQLNYELESGRQSALTMILSLVNSFPEKVLNEHCGVFFLTLGARLVNDDSPDCKKMVSGVLKALLTKISAAQRTKLFEIVLVWLRQKKVSHKRLAAQLAGIFTSLEKEEFTRRLGDLLPLIESLLCGDVTPGRFVKPTKESEGSAQEEDHLLFQGMQLLLKITHHCPKFLVAEEYNDFLDTFTGISQSLLCHPHEWVRLSAAQFLGCVFTSLTPEQVSAALTGQQQTGTGLLQPDFVHQRIKSMILDHCSQLVPGVDLTSDFLDQVTKNLVFFARALKDVTPDGRASNDDIKEQQISLLWLIRRMRRIVNAEIAQTPGTEVLRCAVVKWIGAVTVCLSKENLLPILYNLAAPLVREREAGDTESDLGRLVAEVTTVVKKKVGVEEFTEQAMKLQSRLLERRAIRRTQRMQEFVTNPEQANKRKLDRQVKKKELKRRKMDILKGKKAGKTKKRRKNDDFV